MSMGNRGSNGRTSNQDYTNLLFSDSDSDNRVPDLKLPPVKGKKQKKKRGSSGYRQEETTSCGIGSLMKVFLLLVLFTVVAALGGVTFWSMQKINSLQEKVDKLEQSDAFTPDSMTKFQTQLVSLNKSLNDVKSGSGGVKALTTTIEELKIKVKAFEDTSAKLTEAVKSSKDFFDLPKKFEDLAGVIANMKNNLKAATSITSKQEELEKRLTVLENEFKVTKSPSTEISEGTRPDVQLVEQIQQLNQTTSVSLASFKNRLDQQETKVSTMEEFINRSAATSPMAASLNKVVKDVVQDYMSNLTAPGSLPTTGELDGVLKQVGDMVEEMKSFKPDVENTLTKGEFQLFKDNVMDDFKNVNKSIVAFNGEFEEIFNHLNALESYVNNISIHDVGSQITDDGNNNNNNITGSNGTEGSPETGSDGTEGSSETGSDGTEGSSETGSDGTEGSSETVHKEDKSTSEIPSENDDLLNPTAPSRENELTPSQSVTISTPTKKSIAEGPNGGGEESSSNAPQSTTSSPAPTSELERSIKVENITKVDDLIMAYQKVKPGMTPLNDEELSELLVGNVISEEQKSAMDTDGDGLFSIKEIEKIIEFPAQEGGGSS